MNGFIYILVNASMPGLLKIGQSVRVPEDRAAELSQPTGVPVPYVVAWFEKVSDCVQAERSLHKQLHEYRCNQNREFFYLPLRDAIEVAMQVA